MQARTFRALTKRWEKKLKLSEWRIKYSLLPEHDMLLPGCTGLTDWQPEHKSARIEISNDEDDATIERSVVHELLHIVLEGHESFDFENGKYKVDPQFEYALNVVAEALTAPRRGARG